MDLLGDRASTLLPLRTRSMFTTSWFARFAAVTRGHSLVFLRAGTNPDAYRSRTIREPRAVLAEFGVKILASQRVRVWDSTSEVRYLVVPMRPDRTEGMTEDQLADMVTRDCMIGTALPRAPEASA